MPAARRGFGSWPGGGFDGSAIRKITPDGRVSAFAGSTSGYADGQGATALFGPGLGMAIDANDNIYVADAYNRKIRKITPDGYVSTLAGSTHIAIRRYLRGFQRERFFI